MVGPSPPPSSSQSQMVEVALDTGGTKAGMVEVALVAGGSKAGLVLLGLEDSDPLWSKPL